MTGAAPSGPDDGNESPAAAVGRVVVGLVVMIVGAAIALGSLAITAFGDRVSVFGDGGELVGEGIIFAGIIGVVVAITGFEIMRRSRKSRRAADRAHAAEIMAKLDAVGAYDGTATPEAIARAIDGEPLNEDPTKL